MEARGEEQRKEFERMLKTNYLEDKELVKGDIWYMLSSQWYQKWLSYVDNNDSGAIPGPIDHSSILKEDGSGDIREGLIPGRDYTQIPRKMWDFLIVRYRLIHGQQPIKRKVIEFKTSGQNRLQVEVYPIQVKLCLNVHTCTPVIRKFSRVDTIAVAEEKGRKEFGIPHDVDTRVFYRYANSSVEQLVRKDVTIQELQLYPTPTLIIKMRNPDGSWPRDDPNWNMDIMEQNAQHVKEDENLCRSALELRQYVVKMEARLKTNIEHQLEAGINSTIAQIKKLELLSTKDERAYIGMWKKSLAQNLAEMQDQWTKLPKILLKETGSLREHVSAVEKSHKAALQLLESNAKSQIRKARESVLNKFQEVADSDLECSICKEIIIQAVTLNCGHSFCEYCLNMWRERAPQYDCPLCRKPVETCVRSVMIDSFIENFIDALGDNEIKTNRNDLRAARYNAGPEENEN